MSDFSPGRLPQTDTIKKDQVHNDSMEFEMKRLKNELLYKDLLLNNMKEETAKESKILQKHLALSAEESKKVAIETT